MRRNLVQKSILAELILALVAVVPVVGIQPLQKTRPKPNRPPVIQSFTPSIREIALCPFAQSGTCSPSGLTIMLEAVASDPDNDALAYEYSVSSGSLVGSGAAINWNLERSPLGVHTAKVMVTDHRGGKVSASTTVAMVICGACDPPCTTVSVSCPSTVSEGSVVTFRATVGGDPPGKLTYLWLDSNGKHITGQEGPELKIKATGLPGDVIKATVDVQGLDPSCSRQASCETRVEKQLP